MAKIILTFKDSEALTEVTAAEKKVTDKFIEYDEYVTIEIDTETKTARVVPLLEGNS
jgi:hypothetical protein